MKWFDTSYPAQLQKQLGDKYIVVNKGVRGETSAEISQRQKNDVNFSSDVNIFFVGQNGGFASTEQLIEQIQEMIVAGNSDQYLVLSFHKVNSVFSTIDQLKLMEDSLSCVFGLKFINIRKTCFDYCLLHKRDLSKIDISALESGEVPPFLLLDYWHFNEKGCGVIADAVAKKIAQLGY